LGAAEFRTTYILTITFTLTGYYSFKDLKICFFIFYIKAYIWICGSPSPDIKKGEREPKHYSG